MNLTPATIQFNDQGTPVAQDFDDVYFSNANGIEETRYVFLAQNGIPERWQQCQERRFVVAETGFGTGLNFLTLWQAFDQFTRESKDHSLKCLHFISVEKFPLTRSDLSKALAHWPELHLYAEKLIARYPAAVPGCHRLVFNQGAVILDLWFGDLADALPAMHNHPQGLVDAWFLDGFAPSKNPDMWTDALFQQMARLSKRGGTFATFTAAGIVKRGLKAAGFEVEKRKGFGHKRDMLAGELPTSRDEPANGRARGLQGGYQRLAGTGNSLDGPIAIIGGGMAGANLAYSLAQRGCHVCLYFQSDKFADGASGNAQGGFYPQLNAQFNHASQIQILSYLFARRRYDQLLEQGQIFDHQWCGVLQLAFNDNTLSRYQNMLGKGIWPEDIMQWITADEAQQKAGVDIPFPALWFNQGGWVNPPGLVKALISAASELSEVELLPSKKLVGLNHSGGLWQLEFADGSLAEHANLVLATGADGIALPELNGLPLQAVRGQVESIPTSQTLAKLQTVLCHKGYFCPSYNGRHAMGSTYGKNDCRTDFRSEDTQTNLAIHQRAMATSSWADALVSDGIGRASVRCTSPDHQPLVGAIPDLSAQKAAYEELYLGKKWFEYPLPTNREGLYLLSGFGSRGLTTAPLAAEAMACQLLGDPLPLSNTLLQALNPNRYLLRQLNKHPDHRTV